jgi:hypothetical protein
MYESIQTLSPVEQKKILKGIQERVEGGPSYAEVASGSKSPRSVTPEPHETLATLKRELNSPATPHKGGSKKVKKLLIYFGANYF